jgi:hypothetical protein
VGGIAREGATEGISVDGLMDVSLSPVNPESWKSSPSQRMQINRVHQVDDGLVDVAINCAGHTVRAISPKKEESAF